MALTLFGQAGSGVFQSDATSYTLGVQFSVSQAAVLSAVWFYSPAAAVVLPQTIGLFTVSGKTVASSQASSWSGAVGSGWVRAPLTSPPVLTAGAAYKACVLQNTGVNWYSATSHYWDTGPGSAGITNGILSAPNNAGADVGQDSFHNATVLTYPDTTFQSGNYWVDPEVTAIGSVPVPRVLLTDTWLGTPFAQGSQFVRRGTIVSVVPGSSLETRYGGSSNLGALPGDQSGDDASHANLGN